MLNPFPPDLVVIVHHAQPDGIGLTLNRIEQRVRPIQAAVRPDPHDPDIVPQKFRFQLIVLLGGSLADTHHRFHKPMPRLLLLLFLQPTP